MQNGKENFKEFMKTTKEKTRDGGSMHQQTASIFKYSVLFLLSALIFAFIFAFFDLYHTDPDSARYMLSALVQSQAAIVAIVVSLTLIAVQLTASAYSPRVIRIFRDNLDMWLLLGLYGGSIFYGLLVLKMIRGEDLSQILLFSIHLETHISYAFFLGFFSIVMLFQYMWNIINLLNPANIINRLRTEITKDNLLNTEEDPIQPIMDIVHGSIMNYDIATTRVGLETVTDRMIELIDVEYKAEVAERFCKHMERVAKLAISKLDGESAKEVIKNLENFGEATGKKGHDNATKILALSIGEVGIAAANERLEFATGQATVSLGLIGYESTMKQLNESTKDAIYYLGKVGKIAAEKELIFAAGQAASSLEIVGKAVIGLKLDTIVQLVTEALESIGESAVKTELEDILEQVVDSLGKIGLASAKQGRELDGATRKAVACLGSLGKVFIKNGFLMEAHLTAFRLGLVGTIALQNGLEVAAQRSAKFLAELFILSEEPIKQAINGFKFELNDNELFQKFMEIYEQELEKLRAEK